MINYRLKTQIQETSQKTNSKNKTFEIFQVIFRVKKHV